MKIVSRIFRCMKRATRFRNQSVSKLLRAIKKSIQLFGTIFLFVHIGDSHVKVSYQLVEDLILDMPFITTFID